VNAPESMIHGLLRKLDLRARILFTEIKLLLSTLAWVM
jgi:hypothetical protein